MWSHIPSVTQLILHQAKAVIVAEPDGCGTGSAEVKAAVLGFASIDIEAGQ